MAWSGSARETNPIRQNRMPSLASPLLSSGQRPTAPTGGRFASALGRSLPGTQSHLTEPAALNGHTRGFRAQRIVSDRVGGREPVLCTGQRCQRCNSARPKRPRARRSGQPHGRSLPGGSRSGRRGWLIAVGAGAEHRPTLDGRFPPNADPVEGTNSPELSRFGGDLPISGFFRGRSPSFAGECRRDPSRPAKRAQAASMPSSRWRISASASVMMRSISSLHVGMSWISPATMPQDQTPISISPSSITLG